MSLTLQLLRISRPRGVGAFYPIPALWRAQWHQNRFFNALLPYPEGLCNDAMGFSFRFYTSAQAGIRLTSWEMKRPDALESGRSNLETD